MDNPSDLPEPQNQPPPLPEPPSWPVALLRLAVRAAAIGLVAYFALGALDWIMTAVAPEGDSALTGSQIAMLIFVLLVYACLLAVPFVPGVELGILLLAARGAEIAPFVYLATLGGLLTAYTIGRKLPLPVLTGLLLDLHLLRACQSVREFSEQTPDERLSRLRRGLPDWMGDFPLKYRYLLLAGLINMPGSAILGGGGGLMLVAGLSRVFSTRATILTVFFAVSPVPILVWLTGMKLF